MGEETSSGYWYGKKSFVLLNLLSTATYFYNDPPHSLSRYVAICTSQPTGKSGPQSALTGRLFLWLINSEVSPTGSKPWGRKDDTQEKYVLIFPSCEVPAPLELPQSRRFRSLWVWMLIEVAQDEAASLGVCYKLLGKNICTSTINLLPPS